MIDVPGSEPILFLPFSMETRFGQAVNGTPVLRVRIYPDQISIDTHEPALTPAEVDFGKEYWLALWRLGTQEGTDERPPWRVLAQTYGPQRAAWIARRLEPLNLEMRPPAPTPPGTALNPPPDFPVLAGSDLRPSSWSRKPHGIGLPDHWTVVLTSSRGSTTVPGTKIPPDLAMGPTPNAGSANPDSRDLQLDDGMRWMVDFDAAVGVGMALAIQISAADAADGFDRVIAYGVEPPAVTYTGPAVRTALADATATAGAADNSVIRLIDAHHFTDGFAFVRQGTAANSTNEARLGYTKDDPGFENSFRVERSNRLFPRDGAIAARFLGVPASTFAQIENADLVEQENAKQMAVALWPATMGYVMRHLLTDNLSATQEEEARVYFRDVVRARGPVPAIRVGNTPYGILPVTTLSNFQASNPSTHMDQLLRFLREMHPAWLRSAAMAPRLTRGGNPDQELLEVLGMDASAQSYRARQGVLDEVLLNIWRFFRLGAEAEWLDAAEKPGRGVLDLFGYHGWDPRLIHVLLSRRSFEIPYPIVQDDPATEIDGLETFTVNGVTGNYITWLRTATIDDIRDETYPGSSVPTALLYKVLRQSMLLEYANAAFDMQVAAGAIAPQETKEAVFVGFGSHRATTAWQALDSPVPGGGGLMSTKAYLYSLGPRETAPGTAYARLGELRGALDQLAHLATAELERLFTETLDCFSHRLDPWVTSLATMTLAERRKAGIATTLLGGYAWVEDLRPGAAAQTVGGAERAAVDDLDRSRAGRTIVGGSRNPVREPARDNGGFIHAFSTPQAAAAAVLRHGYLSHLGTSQGKLLAIDLSSDRVRTALALIDGVRQGQSLGALLGYRFEALMHDQTLDAYIEGFRARFPLVANKMAQPGDPAPVSDQPDKVAAPNVSDGLALHDRWVAGASIWGTETPAGGDNAKVNDVLSRIAEILDALGDLSTAEGVYQVMRGNFTRAGGLLDALSRGEQAPDPEIVASPRSGTDLTHRVVLLSTDTPQPPAGHPRAVAEPRLDSWLGTVLTNQLVVKCRATADVAGVPQNEDVDLAALKLSPIDMLSLADAVDQPEGSELEQRAIYVAKQVFPPDVGKVAVTFDRHLLGLAANELSFPELVVVLRAVRDLVAAARPLAPQDLVDPDHRTKQQDSTVDVVGLEQRANDSVAAIKVALDDLQLRSDAVRNTNPPTAAQLNGLRGALLAASLFGVPGAIPLSAKQVANTADAKYTAAAKALVDQAAPVLEAMNKRSKAAQDAHAGWDPNEQRMAVRRDRAVALAQIVFGKGFLLLPTFTPLELDAQNFATARANSAALVGTDVNAIPRWVQQLTHVRAGVSRFDLFETAAALVTGAGQRELEIVQLPNGAAARWLALKPEPGDPDPVPGAASIAISYAPGYNPAHPHAGLVFDEWIERIPSAAETTAIAFHHERPRNRPGNALLLAVSPDAAATWTPESLLQVFNDTLDLARIRTVDLDSITEVGEVLPALYFPFNSAGQTVAVNVAETTGGV